MILTKEEIEDGVLTDEQINKMSEEELTEMIVGFHSNPIGFDYCLPTYKRFVNGTMKVWGGDFIKARQEMTKLSEEISKIYVKQIKPLLRKQLKIFKELARKSSENKLWQHWEKLRV